MPIGNCIIVSYYDIADCALRHARKSRSAILRPITRGARNCLRQTRSLAVYFGKFQIANSVHFITVFSVSFHLSGVVRGRGENVRVIIPRGGRGEEEGAASQLASMEFFGFIVCVCVWVCMYFFCSQVSFN